MGRAIAAISGIALPHALVRIDAVIADFFRSIFREVTDPYRPELHYMRGPGPKWREKHDSRAE